MILKKGQNRKKLPKDLGQVSSVLVRLKLYYRPIPFFYEAHFHQIKEIVPGRPECFTVDQKTRELLIKPTPDKSYELRVIYSPALKEC